MASALKKNAEQAAPRIGEAAAMQPLSGIKRVDETFAVSGMGRAGYVRREDTDKSSASN